MRTCVLLLFALLGAVPPVAAQSGEGTAVTLAALQHVRSTLPEGPAAVDPVGLCAVHLGGWSCPGPVRGAVRSLGLTLKPREFTVLCQPGDRDCRLLDVRSLIRFEEPEIDGNRATIQAMVWRAEAPGQAVVCRVHRLTLAREGSGWAVKEMEAAPEPAGETPPRQVS